MKNKDKPGNNKIHNDMKNLENYLKTLLNIVKNEKKNTNSSQLQARKKITQKIGRKIGKERKHIKIVVLQKKRNPKLISENFSLFYNNIFDDD